MAGKKAAFDLVGFIMDAESGEATQEQIVEGVQQMIDSGIVWNLQGCWGRLAARLIEQGLCTAKK